MPVALPPPKSKLQYLPKINIGLDVDGGIVLPEMDAPEFGSLSNKKSLVREIVRTMWSTWLILSFMSKTLPLG
jgi:hypothetical protein